MQLETGCCLWYVISREVGWQGIGLLLNGLWGTYTSMYESHPWVFSTLPNGHTFRVLADTTRRCEIDLRKEASVRILAKAPFPVITFGPFPTPEALMTSLAHATGTMQMPPKWALGYQQCRWSYETAERVSEVAATFREKKVPCDVVWMDIDYMQGFKCFTFDKDASPDPKGLSDELHSKGFKGIWMLDPGLKAEKGYFACDTQCFFFWILEKSQHGNNIFMVWHLYPKLG